MIQDGVDNDLPVSKSVILQDDPETEVSRKQIWKKWTKLSQRQWCLDNNQVLSAIKLVEKCAGDLITKRIRIWQLQGTSSVAFGFKEILDDVNSTTEEIAIDSTWKTNILGYELYVVIGEASGKAIPLAFMTSISS
uniref:Uncharacterized protein n=1 Tax=Moniliophthora roreri TaxID=221103 RepID=A0A0W0FE48_MONRR